MTLEEFLSDLAACGLDWKIGVANDPARIPEGWVQALAPDPAAYGDRLHVCPLTAVYLKGYGERLPIFKYDVAAARLGLPKGVATEIAMASDDEDYDTRPEVPTLDENGNERRFKIPALRAMILKACGLTE